MELKQLQSFCAVVKYKSFTKAAEKLYLSQPTVSTHVRQLEEEFQTSLIVRTRNRWRSHPADRSCTNAPATL